MSSQHFRALAVAAWLLAICFLLPTAAAYEDYTLFRDGTRVHATVVEAQVRGQRHVAATLRWDDTDWRVYTSGTPSQFAVGRTVDVLLHDNNREPILARDLDEQLPSPWLVVAALASIGVGVFLWRVPSRAAARRARRIDAMEAIVEAAARTRNTCLGYGLGLAPAAALVAILPRLSSAGPGAVIFLELLAAVTLACAAYLLVRAWRLRDPRSNPIVELVLARPQDLASYEVQEVKVKGFSTLSLRLRERDGTQAQLAIVQEDVDVVIGELARRAPDARRLGLIAAAALVLAACGSDEPSWMTEMKPHLQGAIDDHVARVHDAAALLPDQLHAQPCAGAKPGPVIAMPREQLAAKLTAMSLGPNDSAFLTGAPYRVLLGDVYLRSQSVFEEAMQGLTDANLVAVFTTTSLTRGKMEQQGVIDPPGHYEGWVALLQLSPPALLAQAPITADQSEMLMYTWDTSIDDQLADDVEGNAMAAAEAAFLPGCPELVVR